MWYKVVDNAKGKLVSVCRSFYFPEEYRVTYKINEFVFPVVQNTRLFCFKNIEDADSFFYSFSLREKIEIYQCEVKSPAKVKMIAMPCDIKRFWEIKKKRKKIPRFYRCIYMPRNTYSCSAIKLLKRVR